MTIVMYDSVEVSQIPSDATAAAGYVNGNWATFPALRERFPHARVLTITVTASADADALDVENGDATVAQAPGWVKRQIARGLHRPVVYAQASTMGALLMALESQGIARPSVRLWSAHYSEAHICSQTSCRFPAVPACDGTQWTPHALGKDLDESLLLDDFFADPIVTEANWTADGHTSLTALCGKHPGWSPAGVIRRTACHDGKFAPAAATWLNMVFAGTLPATAPVPAGVVLRVPA